MVTDSGETSPQNHAESQTGTTKTFIARTPLTFSFRTFPWLRAHLGAPHSNDRAELLPGDAILHLTSAQFNDLESCQLIAESRPGASKKPSESQTPCDRDHFDATLHVSREELQRTIRDLTNTDRNRERVITHLERAIIHLGHDPNTVYSPPANLTGAALSAYQDGCPVTEDREQGGSRAILCGCPNKSHATDPHPYWNGRFIQ